MKTKLSKKGIQSILIEFNIGELIDYFPLKANRGIIRSQNYCIKTDKGEFVLKMENLNQEDLMFQDKLMDYLHKKKFPIQKMHKTHGKKPYINHKGNLVTIRDYLPGNSIKKLTLKLIKNIAKSMALMHNILLNSKLKKEKDSFDKVFLKYDYLKDKNYKKQKDLYFETINDLKSIDYGLLRKCICHRDICEINMIAKNDEFMGFIDFEEAGTDYFINDIATFLPMILFDFNKNAKKALSIFLKEYETILMLNHEEKKALYYFTKSELFKTSFQNDYYLDFKKIKLNDFINIF